MRSMPEGADVVVYDPNPERLDLFEKEYDARSAASVAEAVRGCDTAVLSCKPQNAEAVFEAARGTLPAEAVVISIVAGLPIRDIVAGLKHDRVVRSMPNTPASVGAGMTVWTCTPALGEAERARAEALLSSLGDAVEVHDETFLDMATALSGSGPAYVLLLAEAMIETGVHLGFPRNLATRLVQNTIHGTGEYLRQSSAGAPVLRNDITSPGGTTAAALYSLERGNFRTVVADGIWAAYRRSLELGKLDSNVGPGRTRKPADL